METKERKTYLDVLRIAAALFVVAIHVINPRAGDSVGADRTVLIVIHTIVRSAVPLFVMISGALWLDPARNVTPRRVARGVARLVCAFAFWSALYAVVQRGLLEGKGIKSILVSFVLGADHMWFIYMMVCLYLLIPLLRAISEKRRLVGYFVILSLFFTFTLPVVMKVTDIEGLSVVNSKTYFYFTLGYVSYFMIGRFLSSAELKRWARYVIYFLGVGSFAAIVFLTLFREEYADQFLTYRLSTFHPFIMLQAAAIFTFARYALPGIRKKSGEKGAIRAVAARTFGVYLVHPLVIEALYRLTGLDVNSIPAALSVPLLVAVVFAVSLGISALVGLIPVVKKYIV